MKLTEKEERLIKQQYQLCYLAGKKEAEDAHIKHLEEINEQIKELNKSY